VGDWLTICGGATANEKGGRQCVQTLLCLEMKLLAWSQAKSFNNDTEKI